MNFIDHSPTRIWSGVAAPLIWTPVYQVPEGSSLTLREVLLYNTTGGPIDFGLMICPSNYISGVTLNENHVVFKKNVSGDSDIIFFNTGIASLWDIRLFTDVIGINTYISGIFDQR